MSSVLNTVSVKASPIQELKLEPKVHPKIRQFLDQPQKLIELTQALGTPLHLLFPEIIKENLKNFHNCFEKNSLKGKVYFAHKANRADSLVRQLSVEAAHIEVASANELRHALSCGFASSLILATGPKNKEFLTLLLMHNIIVSIDSLPELIQILSLREQLNISYPTRVLLRVCGFRSEHTKFLSKASRFGITISEIDKAFSLLSANTEGFSLLGFAFHSGTVNIPEKALAIENCFELFDQALSYGLSPTVLNIGGSFKVNYLNSKDEWHNYIDALRQSVLGVSPKITWQGNSFGFMAENGTVKGNFNSYPYYDSVTGPRFLEDLLAYELPTFNSTSITNFMRDNGIEIWIEPGRSLLDQTGVSIVEVNSVRTSSDGETLICLNMNRQNLCVLDQEVFVDPLVFYRNKPLITAPFIPVYFAGNLCLESDLITRRQVFLPAVPQAGDLIMFINTAGYFMDFSVSQASMHPEGKKIAVFEKRGEFAWSLDEQYQPWFTA